MEVIKWSDLYFNQPAWLLWSSYKIKFHIAPVQPPDKWILMCPIKEEVSIESHIRLLKTWQGFRQTCTNHNKYMKLKPYLHVFICFCDALRSYLGKVQCSCHWWKHFDTPWICSSTYFILIIHIYITLRTDDTNWIFKSLDDLLQYILKSHLLYKNYTDSHDDV